MKVVFSFAFIWSFLSHVLISQNYKANTYFKRIFLAYWNLIQTIVLNLTISMTQILALAIKLWCYNLFKNSIVQLIIIIIILLLLLN